MLLPGSTLICDAIESLDKSVHREQRGWVGLELSAWRRGPESRAGQGGEGKGRKAKGREGKDRAGKGRQPGCMQLQRYKHTVCVAPQASRTVINTIIRR